MNTNSWLLLPYLWCQDWILCETRTLSCRWTFTRTVFTRTTTFTRQYSAV